MLGSLYSLVQLFYGVQENRILQEWESLIQYKVTVS